LISGIWETFLIGTVNFKHDVVSSAKQQNLIQGCDMGTSELFVSFDAEVKIYEFPYGIIGGKSSFVCTSLKSGRMGKNWNIVF
jgi:hypothetical protein